MAAEGTGVPGRGGGIFSAAAVHPCLQRRGHGGHGGLAASSTYVEKHLIQ